MLRTFRSWASDDTNEDDEHEPHAGGESHHEDEDPDVAERRSLLDVEDGAPLHRREDGLIAGTSSSNSNNNNNGGTTTGMMNPQDDLDQTYPDGTSATSASAAFDSHSDSVTDPLMGSVPTRRMQPASLVAEDSTSTVAAGGGNIAMASNTSTIVSRRKGERRHRRRRHRSNSASSEKPLEGMTPAVAGPLDTVCSMCLRTLCFDRTMVRNTLTCMHVMARVLLWASFFALGAAVIWYSYELFNNGYVGWRRRKNWTIVLLCIVLLVCISASRDLSLSMFFSFFVKWMIAGPRNT